MKKYKLLANNIVQMLSETKKLFDKEIFISSRPFSYYISLVIFLSAFIATASFLIAHTEPRDAVMKIIILYFFAFLLYANIGQYLAIIALYNHKIEVRYLFPWNKSFVFEFDYITDMDFKDVPTLFHRNRWYVGGKWLYFKNEHGDACQFKYNINNVDDKRLLNELEKKVKRNIKN